MKVMTETKLLNHLKQIIISAVQFVPEVPKNALDFDSPLLTDSAYETYTGLSKHDFEDLIPYLSGSIHDSVNRSKRNALAIFLCKLRMNNSQNALGELFGMDQQRISEVFHNVAEALHKKFVPLNLGYQHISRDDFIKDHSRTLASVFFDQQPNSCMLVLDGTYLEIEKSSNFQLQHDSFSGHKHYNLVKPMLVTGTDGYIIGAEGLYLGNNNDASILSSMMVPGSPFETFVEEDDILILDRGFRDNKTELDEAGIRMVMPNLLTGGRKQFQDTEANESRLVTMIRWVIEAVNGRLKNKFKFFRDRISNNYMANGFLMKLVKIACAILNKYFAVVAPYQEGDLERAQLIKSKAGISNLLMELIIQRGWLTSRANYLSMELEQLEDFPKLTMECLRDISMGIYQIRMARSYTAQHVHEGEYQFSVHREMPDLIRVKIKSRFRGDTVHTLWIHYRPNGIGPGSIQGFYCRCQSGARTLGCCSHIMSVLWYFGIGRHNRHLKFPAENIGANLLDVR